MERKHGLKSRERSVSISRGLEERADVCRAAVPSQRLTTMLTFETNRQAYLWFTDRGRSRLVKH